MGHIDEILVSKIQVGDKSVLKGQRRQVINLGATTAETNLGAADSGAMILLDGTASQIQVINLPTVTSDMVGIFYDFNVLAIGNSGAAGSYTINTGGHATDATATPTKGFDDFIGVVKVLDNAAYTTADKSNIVPAGGEGALILADDTTNGVVAVGSQFRCTAVAASTIGTAAGNTWLIEGTLMSAQATGFVTTNVFTAP